MSHMREVFEAAFIVSIALFALGLLFSALVTIARNWIESRHEKSRRIKNSELRQYNRTPDIRDFKRTIR